ncbi:MAG: rubredoxin [Desulfobulbaceae bacterium]|nr:MAG: rubredoxin [Desulfobulbaceae bacterium]
MSSLEEVYQCQTTNCGYVFDPDKGDRRGRIRKGTQFKNLPDDWRCTVCGATVKSFKPLAGSCGSVYAENVAISTETETKGATNEMKKYRCDICGYVYDPAMGDDAAGIAAGTSFDDLSDDYQCPVCGAGKDEFSEM